MLAITRKRGYVWDEGSDNIALKETKRKETHRGHVSRNSSLISIGIVTEIAVVTYSMMRGPVVGYTASYDG